MIGYILRRLVATAPVMLIVAVLVFLMLRLTPGDPAAIIAGDNANAEQVAAIRNRLGLDEPIFTQFFIWFGNILRGDFGESFFFKKTVAELIASRLEPTLALSIATIIIAVCVAVPLGVLAAYKQGTLIDKIVMGFSVLGFSVPVFVIGYSLIYLFAIKLNWLPVQGYQRIGDGFGGFLQRLILPSVTLSVIYIALIARMTRTSVLDVMGEDYIRTARAKGQVEIKVLFTPCAEECRGADRHRDRPRRRAADRRRGRHRKRVHHSGPRPAHRRRRAGARLSDHPGGDPAVLVRLRADQPARRPRLHAARPEDTLLSVEPALLAGEKRRAAPQARPDRPARARRQHHLRRASSCC